MSDETPGDSEYARIACEWSVRQFGQLAVKCGWKIVSDLADLRLDDVIIVDQPLGGGGDWIVILGRLRDGAIRIEQGPFVVSKPRGKRSTDPGPRRDALRGREALGMLLEALRAEQFRSDRSVGLPERTH